MPNCYIIAGCNGSGKSTFASEFLPKYMNCYDFINPDLIAAGLSPFNPEAAAIRAGRYVLDEIENRIHNKKDFTIETTLSGKTYLRVFKKLKERGFAIHIFYLWIPSIDLSLKRIAERVAMGGHNVPEKDARRRFVRSLPNFLKLYLELCDTARLFDNSAIPPKLVASCISGKWDVKIQGTFKIINEYGGGQ